MIIDAIVSAGSRPAATPLTNRSARRALTRADAIMNSLRREMLDAINKGNEDIGPERRVSYRTGAVVVNRAIAAAQDAGLPPESQKFAALRALNAFILLSRNGVSEPDAESPANANTDLLPAGHPLSTAPHRMSPEALQHARSRWAAAGPELTPTARAAITAALAARTQNDRFSPERAHALERALSQPAAAPIPRATLTALLADGNSRAARSARARAQRRDRKGRWAYQGGGLRFRLSDGKGNSALVTGRVVGYGPNNSFDVELDTGEVVRVPANKTETVKAVLPLTHAQQQEARAANSTAGGTPAASKMQPGVSGDFDALDVVTLDRPYGWEPTDPTDPDATRAYTDGDYVVNVYPSSASGERSQETTDRLKKSLIETKKQNSRSVAMLPGPTSKFIWSPDDEIFEIRRKSDNQIVGYSQTWSGTTEVTGYADKIDISSKKKEKKAELPPPGSKPSLAPSMTVGKIAMQKEITPEEIEVLDGIDYTGTIGDGITYRVKGEVRDWHDTSVHGHKSAVPSPSVSIELSGDTYAHRDKIKALGFKWDPDKKTWSKSQFLARRKTADENMHDVHAQLSALGDVSGPIAEISYDDPLKKLIYTGTLGKDDDVTYVITGYRSDSDTLGGPAEALTVRLFGKTAKISGALKADQFNWSPNNTSWTHHESVFSGETAQDALYRLRDRLGKLVGNIDHVKGDLVNLEDDTTQYTDDGPDLSPKARTSDDVDTAPTPNGDSPTRTAADEDKPGWATEPLPDIDDALDTLRKDLNDSGLSALAKDSDEEIYKFFARFRDDIIEMYSNPNDLDDPEDRVQTFSTDNMMMSVDLPSLYKFMLDGERLGYLPQEDENEDYSGYVTPAPGAPAGMPDPAEITVDTGKEFRSEKRGLIEVGDNAIHDFLGKNQREGVIKRFGKSDDVSDGDIIYAVLEDADGEEFVRPAADLIYDQPDEDDDSRPVPDWADAPLPSLDDAFKTIRKNLVANNLDKLAKDSDEEIYKFFARFRDDIIEMYSNPNDLDDPDSPAQVFSTDDMMLNDVDLPSLYTIITRGEWQRGYKPDEGEGKDYYDYPTPAPSTAPAVEKKKVWIDDWRETRAQRVADHLKARRAFLDQQVAMKTDAIGRVVPDEWEASLPKTYDTPYDDYYPGSFEEHKVYVDEINSGIVDSLPETSNFFIDNVEYSRDIGGQTLRVRQSPDGTLRIENFPGEYIDWDALEAALPDIARQNYALSRDALADDLTVLFGDLDVVDMIRSGAPADDVRRAMADLDVWTDALADLDTSHYVDLPTPYQKGRWERLRKARIALDNLLDNPDSDAPEADAYIEDAPHLPAGTLPSSPDLGQPSVDDDEPESFALLQARERRHPLDPPRVPRSWPQWEREQAQPAEDVAPEDERASRPEPELEEELPEFYFSVPEGAYPLNFGFFEPEGRDDQDSPDYTDDPAVLAHKFSESELVDALGEAIVARKDASADFIDETIADANESANDPFKKGTPGAKKKKAKNTTATGFGLLSFDQSDEYVPAEAIYLALAERGIDVEALTADLYDSRFDDETPNRDLLALSRGEADADGLDVDVYDLDEEDVSLERIFDEMSANRATDIADGEIDGLSAFNRPLEPVEDVEPTLFPYESMARSVANNVGAVDPENIPEAVANLGAFIDSMPTPTDPDESFNNAYAFAQYIAPMIARHLDGTASEYDTDMALAGWGIFSHLDNGDGGVDGSVTSAIAANVAEYMGVELKDYGLSPDTPMENRETDDKIYFVHDMYERMGTFDDFKASRAAYAEDPESSEAQLYARFAELLVTLARPNEVRLYRGASLRHDHADLDAHATLGGVISMPPSSWSAYEYSALNFSRALYPPKPDPDGVVRESILYTVEPGTVYSVPLQKLSWYYDEDEEIVLGTFAVETTAIGKNMTSMGMATARETRMVGLRPLTPPEQIRIFNDGDYSDRLQSNDFIPTPDGTYELSTDAYVPDFPEGETYDELPEGFTDSPLYLAEIFDDASMIEQLRAAISDGTGLGWFELPLGEDGEGFETGIPAEAIRDALQINGVNTGDVLRDIAEELYAAQPGETQDEGLGLTPITDSGLVDVGAMTNIGGAKGSNVGGTYRDEAGDEYYVKYPKSNLHAATEVLAARLYKETGVPAAEMLFGEDADSEIVTVSPMIPGAKSDFSSHLDESDYMARVHEGFAIDAWLANWDVAGLVYDNVVTAEDGTPTRVDPGGALLFRAQGAPKGGAFGDEVTELDTLRDPDKNPQSHAVFGSMSDDAARESARKLLDMTPERIDEIINNVWTQIQAPDDQAELLRQRLIARRQYILDYFGLTEEQPDTPSSNGDGDTAIEIDKPEVDLPTSPPPASAYVDANGEQLAVGDTVTSKKDGLTGTIMKLDPANTNYVYIKTADGKKKTRSTKTLEKTPTAPESVESYAPEPVNEPEATSPADALEAIANAPYNSATTPKMRSLSNLADVLDVSYDELHSYILYRFPDSIGEYGLQPENITNWVGLSAKEIKMLVDALEGDPRSPKQAIQDTANGVPLTAGRVYSPDMTASQAITSIRNDLRDGENGEQSDGSIVSLVVDSRPAIIEAMIDGNTWVMLAPPSGYETNVDIDAAIKILQDRGYGWELPVNPSASSPTEPTAETPPTPTPIADEIGIPEPEASDIAEAPVKQYISSDGHELTVGMHVMSTKDGLKGIVAKLDPKNTNYVYVQTSDGKKKARSVKTLEVNWDEELAKPLAEDDAAPEMPSPFEEDGLAEWEKELLEIDKKMAEELELPEPPMTAKSAELKPLMEYLTATEGSWVYKLSKISSALNTTIDEFIEYIAKRHPSLEISPDISTGDVYIDGVAANKIYDGLKNDPRQSVEEIIQSANAGFDPPAGRLYPVVSTDDALKDIARAFDDVGYEHTYEDDNEEILVDQYPVILEAVYDGKTEVSITPKIYVGEKATTINVASAIAILSDKGFFFPSVASGSDYTASSPNTTADDGSSLTDQEKSEKAGILNELYSLVDSNIPSMLITTLAKHLSTPTANVLSYIEIVEPDIAKRIQASDWVSSDDLKTLADRLAADPRTIKDAIHETLTTTSTPTKSFEPPPGSTGFDVKKNATLSELLDYGQNYGLTPLHVSQLLGVSMGDLLAYIDVAHPDIAADDIPSTNLLTTEHIEEIAYRLSKDSRSIIDAITQTAAGVPDPNAPEQDQDTDAPEPFGPPPGAPTLTDMNGDPLWVGAIVETTTGLKGTVIKLQSNGTYVMVQFDDGKKLARATSKLKVVGASNTPIKTKTSTKVLPTGVPAVVPDTPVTWDKSYIESTPSLTSALEYVRVDGHNATHGVSVASDSGDVEDNDVRITRVYDENGNESILLKFRLTDWAGVAYVKQAAADKKNNDPTAPTSLGSLRVQKMHKQPDGIMQLDVATSFKDDYRGETWESRSPTSSATGRDAKILIHRAVKGDKPRATGSDAPRAFHNLVQIVLPADATEEDIAAALQKAGVRDARPATDADVRITIENRLLSLFNQDTNPAYNESGSSREAALKNIETKWGVTAADVRIVQGADGRVEYRLPTEVAQKIRAKTKVKVFQHSMSLPKSLSTWGGLSGKSDEEIIDAYVDFYLELFAGDHDGLLSTTTRWSEGVGINGQSSHLDVNTGGADYVFVRPDAYDPTPQANSGSPGMPRLYFDGTSVLERLDIYANMYDKFGARKNNHDIIGSIYPGAYETMLKHRLSWADLRAVVIPNQTLYERFIEALEARGIFSIGGIPLDMIFFGPGMDIPKELSPEEREELRKAMDLARDALG